MEGTGNGKQRHVLFRIILDEQVDDIAFLIDHVCGCRSDPFNGLGRMGRGNTYGRRDCWKEKNLETRRWLWLCHRLFGDCLRVRTPSITMRRPCYSNDSQVEEKRVTRDTKSLAKEAKRIVVWAYRI